MDPVERLIALEDIRQLISRRTRYIDGKHWEKLEGIYTEDVVGHHQGTKGPKELVAYVKKSLENMRTVHQVHLPEIEITSPTTAKGIVPMEDLLIWEEDGIQRWVHGYGHYHQEYRKTDRGWQIFDHNLTRQYIQEGYGDFDPSVGPGKKVRTHEMPITPLPEEF